MTTRLEKFIKTCDKAELKVTNICSLLNISRITFYRWRKAGDIPDKYLGDVERIEKSLLKLLKENKLPIDVVELKRQYILQE